MGREPEAHRPGWILEWLTWVLGEALSEPAEQQTRMVPHTFERATFYRIDYQMQRSIGPDKVKEIETLVGYGEQLANQVDWKDILAGKEAVHFVSAPK